MTSWNVDEDALLERYEHVRSFTETLCDPLETEDYVVQSMPDASPAKWHLAHTSWFFDRFILQDLCGADPIDERYNYLFNSYYTTAGELFSRPKRGVLSRPTVGQVQDYRRQVDVRMTELLGPGQFDDPRIATHVDLGLHHEQQHQELLVTDTKHMFAQNPIYPEVIEETRLPEHTEPAGPAEWIEFNGGLYEIGYGGKDFSFDNERPRHEVRLYPFELARRPVTCDEYIEFIEDGGYERSDHWLSEGWAIVQQEEWAGPLYWQKHDGDWHVYTLFGLREVDPEEPVCHVSFYEAQAFADWAGARLPTEQQWEVASQIVGMKGHFLESGRRHPARLADNREPPLLDMFGNVWEWTTSSYAPYPGFEPFGGNLGEYNGKFMCSQYVLRGGSCATPQNHIRRTYRNFFYPDARWQFSGFRLARD